MGREGLRFMIQVEGGIELTNTSVAHHSDTICKIERLTLIMVTSKEQIPSLFKIALTSLARRPPSPCQDQKKVHQVTIAGLGAIDRAMLLAVAVRLTVDVDTRNPSA